MSTVINLADARARGIKLPDDDDAAQDILDEQEAYLASRIGALTGSRAETFYVGVSETRGKLGLRRPTNAVTLTDAGSAVDADHIRLVDYGASVVRTYDASGRWWTGPYVVATYTPNDEVNVRRVLYDLVALAVDLPGPYMSERLGEYSYTRPVVGVFSVNAQRAALVASLMPKRDQLVTVAVSRPIVAVDPVVNRAEPPT
jgi:hypothetical protein